MSCLDKRFEIRYGAVGGQGIITAGALLVDIVVQKENGFALESPTYTATVRGGPTKVDVILSNKPIMFPQATAIDFFVCTYQVPFDLYKSRLRDDAIVVVDSHLVKDLGDTRNWKIHSIPIINETKKQLGNVILTSVVTDGLALQERFLIPHSMTYAVHILMWRSNAMSKSWPKRFEVSIGWSRMVIISVKWAML